MAYSDGAVKCETDEKKTADAKVEVVDVVENQRKRSL